MNISESEYKMYRLMARKITPHDYDELLHETLSNLLVKSEIKKGKDAYVYVCLRNTFRSWKKQKKIDFKELSIAQEPNELPEHNHIFKVIKQLEMEGKQVHANRFIQAKFSISSNQLAIKQGVSLSTIEKSIKLVKNEIKKRYQND